MPWPLASCRGVSPLLLGFSTTSTKSSLNRNMSSVDLQWLIADAKCNGVCSITEKQWLNNSKAGWQQHNFNGVCNNYSFIINKQYNV